MSRLRPAANSLLVLLAIIGGCLFGMPACAAGQPLVLALSIDGVAHDEPVLAYRREDGLWIAAGDVSALARWAGAGGAINLDRAAGLAYRLDPAAQSLAITLAVPIDPRARPPAPEVTPNGWGAYLNYDTVATAVRGHTAFDAAIDMHLFSPRIVAFNGLLLHAGDRSFGPTGLTRLDSGISLADLRRDRRWTAGDLIGGATSVSRPVRLGGIQISTDFGLRPDLVTFPVPLATGAAVPSAVDLVTDSVARQAAPAAPGAFASAAAPVTTGVNSVSVIARDALGRESVRTLSFYTSRSLLLPGLSATSIEAGLIRTGYGSTFDRYRRFAAIGTYRRGLLDSVTVEGHGEFARGIASVGGGASVGLGRLGLAYVSGGVSSGRVFGRSGGVQMAVGWERLSRPVSVSARYVRNSAGFADIAALYGSPVRRETLIGNVGFDLARFGNLSLSVVRLGRGRQTGADTRLTNRPFDPVDGRLDAPRLASLTLANATFAVPVARRFSLVASGTRTLGHERGVSASAGLLMTLGPRINAQAAVDARGGGTSGRFALARPAVAPGDTGFHVDIATGLLDRQAAAIEHIGTQGRYQAAVERIGGTAALRAGAQGALVLVPGGLFRADRIDGSFALVDTHGEARVPVFRENRSVGATGRRGFLVVTGLLPYQANKISLDPDALDDSVAVGTAERLLRPRDRIGVAVDFGIRRVEAAVVRLVDENGAVIPAGSRASLNGRAPVPVGMDGEVYLVDPDAGNRLVVAIDEGRRCEARFARPAPRRGPDGPMRLVCAAAYPESIASAQMEMDPAGISGR